MRLEADALPPQHPRPPPTPPPPPGRDSFFFPLGATEGSPPLPLEGTPPLPLAREGEMEMVWWESLSLATRTRARDPLSSAGIHKEWEARM